MALSEITLLKPNGYPEIRYTDRLPSVRGTVRIDGRAVTVVSRHTDVATRTPSRFVCRLSQDDPSGQGHKSDLRPGSP